VVDTVDGQIGSAGHRRRTGSHRLSGENLRFNGSASIWNNLRHTSAHEKWRETKSASFLYLLCVTQCMKQAKQKQKQSNNNNLNLDRLPPPSTPTALMNRILVGVFHSQFLAVLLSIDWFGSPGGFVAQSLSVPISSIKNT